MSAPAPVRSRLTDEQLSLLRITRATADVAATAARVLGPLTQDQRDTLSVLLRPDTPYGTAQMSR